MAMTLTIGDDVLVLQSSGGATHSFAQGNIYKADAGNITDLQGLVDGGVGRALVIQTIAGTYTSNQVNATTNTAVRAIIGSITASGTGMTSGFSATGVRGLSTISGTITGNAYVYGTQGKVVAGGTIGGQSWVAGILAQLDLSAATTYSANTGGTMALWVDAGASAHANAIAAAPTLIDLTYLSNSISGFKPHSFLRCAGDATNLFALGDWAGGTSADWIALGGTSCTSSGSTAPYGTLKILVGTQTCYIRVWAAK
jgi:hypothetical protein